MFVVAACAAGASAQGVKPTLDSRWADLAGADDGKATRALLALAATPKETVAFLKDHLKPVKADPKRVAQLVKALESTTFSVRVQATAELEYLGKYIKADLEAAQKSAGDIETKMRIQHVLAKIPSEKKPEPPQMPRLTGRSVGIRNVNGEITILIDGQPLDLSKLAPPPPPPPPLPPTGWVRAVRAVTLLEHLATPEARDLLEAIAAGEPDAMPTAAAREALGRLKK
jgi:hypothetical protein